MSSKTLQVFDLEGEELDEALQATLDKKPADVDWKREDKCVLCDDKEGVELHKTKMMFSSMNLKFVKNQRLKSLACDDDGNESLDYTKF